MKTRVHRGSNFRDYLSEEGLLEDVEELAMKRAIAEKVKLARRLRAETTMPPDWGRKH